MVQHQNHQDQLFYTYQELSRSSRQNFYIQLKGAGLDWEKLSKPFEAAFSQRVGRPTDPVVYLKAFLVAYFENITYDTLAGRIMRIDLETGKILGAMESPGHWLHVAPTNEIFIGSLAQSPSGSPSGPKQRFSDP